jgi:hypothetical protein
LAGLLDVDPDLGMTPWVWLQRQAPSSVPAAVKEQLAKVELLREITNESTLDDVYDGSAFTRDGVVTVTINYRWDRRYDGA